LLLWGQQRKIDPLLALGGGLDAVLKRRLSVMSRQGTIDGMGNAHACDGLAACIGDHD